MKTKLITFILCFVSIVVFAETKELGNGWKMYQSTSVLHNNPINGIYTFKIDDNKKFSMYMDVVSNGDTICELFLDCTDDLGDKKVFYLFDEKATYYFNTFADKETERFAAIRFEYNDENDFSTGFNVDGLAQNKLAKQIANKILNGHDVRFVAMPSMAEYQEIKEFVVPGIK